jgi:2-methylcitrate dehydratase PrpD
VAVVGGAEALMPLSPDWLQRPDIVALARRVNLHVDPELDARFPAETGARIWLKTAGGILGQTIRHPLGDPANPMDRTRLVDKFKKLTAGVIAAQDRAGLLALIDRLADLADGTQIVDCLRGPDLGDTPHR